MKPKNPSLRSWIFAITAGATLAANAVEYTYDASSNAGVLTINANSAGTNTAISGNISGPANVNVQNTGAPILSLSGTNTYTGTTTVAGGGTAGTLIVNGDQIYDSQSKPLDRSSDFNRHHDYLYKWYLWELPAHVMNRVVPTIAVPDDHDVLQGNLRGEDGVSSASGDPGGYTSPASCVKMVERTQTNKLPDADPYNAAQPAATAAQGIKNVSPAWAMAASASPSSTLFFRLRQPALSTALIPNVISWQQALSEKK